MTLSESVLLSFFASKQRKRTSKKEDKGKIEGIGIGHIIVLNLKKLGFNFAEIDEMTMNDYVDILDLENDDVERVREATQSDIDSFFGGGM